MQEKSIHVSMLASSIFCCVNLMLLRGEKRLGGGGGVEGKQEERGREFQRQRERGRKEQIGGGREERSKSCYGIKLRKFVRRHTGCNDLVRST